MTTEKNSHLRQALEYWKGGQPREAGRLIFENLPSEVRPKWAAQVLETVLKRTGIKSKPIDHILYISKHPNEWHKGHDASSKIGGEISNLINRPDVLKRTIRFIYKLIGSNFNDELLVRHLALAKFVARVTYNATNPDDEFDEDNGWYIASSLKDILDLLNDEKFSESMWPVLCNGLVKPEGKGPSTQGTPLEK